ncbi:MAG: hypothetical protein ACYTFA_17330, partial [Planctomycetota bacterium]
ELLERDSGTWEGRWLKHEKMSVRLIPQMPPLNDTKTPQQRRAFVVTGPEGSGNRYLTKLLVSAGCWGKGKTEQPVDEDEDGFSLKLPDPLPELLVFFRSVPHALEWNLLRKNLQELRGAGYETTVLIVIRDPEFLEQSQIRSKHVTSTDQARGQIGLAFQQIFAACYATGAEVIPIPYSSLGRAGFTDWLSERLRLPRVPGVPFVDGDAKYVE